MIRLSNTSKVPDSDAAIEVDRSQLSTWLYQSHESKKRMHEKELLMRGS
jgi:hypothetical protein